MPALAFFPATRTRSRPRATATMLGAVVAMGGGSGQANASVLATSPSDPATSVPMTFDVQGSAQVRTGIRGRVSIAGTFNGTYDPSTNRFVGGFSLTPTRAHVVVLGLLPVIAETDWEFTEPVTGEWRDGVMQMRIAARIRHPNLYAFGSVRLAGGPNCATVRPSVIELRSNATTPIVGAVDGGTLTTSGNGFTISALAGCGPLDGLLSAVAAGSGNQATVTLTPPRIS